MGQGISSSRILENIIMGLNERTFVNIYAQRIVSQHSQRSLPKLVIDYLVDQDRYLSHDL